MDTKPFNAVFWFVIISIIIISLAWVVSIVFDVLGARNNTGDSTVVSSGYTITSVVMYGSLIFIVAYLSVCAYVFKMVGGAVISSTTAGELFWIGIVSLVVFVIIVIIMIAFSFMYYNQSRKVIVNKRMTEIREMRTVGTAEPTYIEMRPLYTDDINM